MKEKIVLVSRELPYDDGEGEPEKELITADLCERCDKPIDNGCECYSCCGDLLDEDIRICPTCKEWC